MTDPDLLQEIGRWLRYARDDLRAAERLAEIKDTAPRIACFHAQQAAEKAIKACLLFLQTGVPRTHDLIFLTELLPEGWRLKEDLSELLVLSEWATEPRYPGDVPEATQGDAEAAVEQARKVYETALKDLENHGYGQREEEARNELAEEDES